MEQCLVSEKALLAGQAYSDILQTLASENGYQPIDDLLKEQYNFSLYKKNGEMKSLDDALIEIRLLRMGIAMYHSNGEVKSPEEVSLEYKQGNMEVEHE